MIRPVSGSRSIRSPAGVLGSPGISCIPEQIAVKNPAPANIRSSLIGTVKPVGRPFSVGSWERERGVFAIQIGMSANPSRGRRLDLGFGLLFITHTGRPVHAAGNGFNLLLDGSRVRIEWPVGRTAFARRHHGTPEFFSPLPPSAQCVETAAATAPAAKAAPHIVQFLREIVIEPASMPSRRTCARSEGC